MQRFTVTYNYLLKTSTMKNVLKITFLAVLIGITASCKKKNSPTPDLSHDSNQLMSVIHSMINKMDALEMTKDPDNDFALMMQVHHQGAIDMAKLEIQNGKDAFIKQMAQTMIQKQEGEIAILGEFLKSHGPDINVPAFDTKSMEIMDTMSKNADAKPLKGKVDQDFASFMILHHQSAIDIAQLELQYGDETRMRNLASAMITDQQKEIADLQKWLNQQ